ncbi:hypothetical protein CONPUDRAFT_139998 [Coniophora puteana RWD-64-598 SS2]|uniref:Uncharacterized protein n=1 Tax=Coniophora puteana (strain RWD-64-598) TaxID=741705 RepID=A0A5M3M8K7_CONPW|nr:uncharacterized protein CONPUDRAFT_139998 [Coniophora puteana RWD-64-598 SS2]EIW75509.1 hypothetical protein CONPUDRAFT_139998 [Coniophora puteana RWD-64-598 SS2]
MVALCQRTMRTCSNIFLRAFHVCSPIPTSFEGLCMASAAAAEGVRLATIAWQCLTRYQLDVNARDAHAGFSERVANAHQALRATVQIKICMCPEAVTTNSAYRNVYYLRMHFQYGDV